MTIDRLVVHTDGACHGNPGPGGYGAFWELDGHRWEVFGGVRDTTNNRMELGAVIGALRALRQAQDKGLCPPSPSLIIRSDSQYVIKGATEWRQGWKKKGWRGSDGKPVKNLEIWQMLDGLLEGLLHPWGMQWVKGHSGDIHNEHADSLAQEGVAMIKASREEVVHAKRKSPIGDISVLTPCATGRFR